MAALDEEGEGHRAVCLHTFIVSAPPSCIEFSQLKGCDLFVVGTYSLNEKEGSDEASAANALDKTEGGQSQSRSGSLLLFRLHTDCTVTLLQTVATESAVLDLHFSPHDQELLATAISTGAIILSRLDATAEKLETCKVIQAFDSSTLVLSLAWNPNHDFKDLVACTLSTGAVVTIDTSVGIGDADTQVIRQCFEAHSLEAWTVTWSRNGLYVLSGGDDSVIRMWDANATGTSDDLDMTEQLPADKHFERNLRDAPPLISIPGTLTDSRTHQAGVTAILPLALRDPADGNVVVTGSYDEFIRVLEPKVGRSWTTLAEKRLGGGVWRLKLLDLRSKGSEFTATILASCMHAGPRVVEIRRHDSAWSIRVISRFEEHESMNYGSDFHGWDSERFDIVSTSFYDRKLCVHRQSALLDMSPATVPVVKRS